MPQERQNCLLIIQAEFKCNDRRNIWLERKMKEYVIE